MKTEIRLLLGIQISHIFRGSSPCQCTCHAMGQARLMCGAGGTAEGPGGGGSQCLAHTRMGPGPGLAHGMGQARGIGGTRRGAHQVNRGGNIITLYKALFNTLFTKYVFYISNSQYYIINMSFYIVSTQY